ncbi:MAG: HPr(Ser) kinase/phosphatase [Gammaproteobacteria bacterium]
MTDQITVAELYNNHAPKLELEWVAGQEGGKRIIVPETSGRSAEGYIADDVSQQQKNKPRRVDIPNNKSLIGYLNLIHPHQIQVLGVIELSYLESLRDISRQDALRQLFSHQPACLVVSESQTIPTLLRRRCNEQSIPLFTTGLSSTKLTESLHYYLSNLFADVTILHGVFMEVMAIGVLITGPSGIGKSELALELITRGHRLVADDAPQFSRIAPDIINGYCPDVLTDFLEVRGLGIINVRELFGNNAIKSNKYLRLIIRLEPMDKERLLKLDRLEGSYRTQRVLDVDVPEITVPVAPGRNLAVLVECAAHTHLLRISGYNASHDFAERQRQLMQQSAGK